MTKGVFIDNANAWESYITSRTSVPEAGNRSIPVTKARNFLFRAIGNPSSTSHNASCLLCDVMSEQAAYGHVQYTVHTIKTVKNIKNKNNNNDDETTKTNNSNSQFLAMY
jgi:hypothetical protein